MKTKIISITIMLMLLVTMAYGQTRIRWGTPTIHECWQDAYNFVKVKVNVDGCKKGDRVKIFIKSRNGQSSRTTVFRKDQTKPFSYVLGNSAFKAKRNSYTVIVYLNGSEVDRCTR